MSKQIQQEIQGTLTVGSLLDTLNKAVREGILQYSSKIFLTTPEDSKIYAPSALMILSNASRNIIVLEYSKEEQTNELH